MSFLRWFAYLLALLALVFVLAAFFVVHNKDAFARLALERIHERTGLEIRISATRFGVDSHLLIVLEHPRVFANQVEVAQLHDLRIVLSYGAIIRGRGLPLTRLVLDRPRVMLPATNPNLDIAGIRSFDAQAVKSFNRGLQALSDTVRRIDLLDGAIVDQDNQALVDNLYLRASQHRHPSPGHHGWRLDLAAQLTRPPVAGLQLTALFSTSGEDQPAELFNGQLWFWGLELHDFDAGRVRVSGDLDGELRLRFDNRGIFHGQTTIHGRRLALSGPALTSSLALGEYQLASPFQAGPDELDLPRLALHHDSATVLTGNLRLLRPFEQTRGLSVDGQGVALELKRVAAMLRPFRNVPPTLMETASRVTAGRLLLEQVALDSDKPLRDWTPATLRDDLRVQARLQDGGYQFPPAAKIPPLRRINAQLDYASGKLSLSQAAAALGASTLAALSAEADLRALPARLPYQLRTTASLDLAELKPVLMNALAAADPALSRRITDLRGRLPLTLRLDGDLPALRPRMPSQYQLAATLNQAQISFARAPVAIMLAGGAIAADPKLITISKLRLTAATNSPGYAIVNGVIQPGGPHPIFRAFTIEPHQIDISNWLPLLIEPDVLSATGRVGGSLTLDGAVNAGSLPQAKGKLTLTDGALVLGFLRSPIETQAATLTFDGKGLALDMPGSRLEGQPLSYRMTVADLRHPAVRIDATAARLDFEVMRFIRLPWSPATPPHFFSAPVSGHLEAREAHFDKLPLSQVSTDFDRDAADWHVSKFRAKVFDGAVRLDISGRSRDNWIDMKGKIAELQAGPLFTMLNSGQPAALTGRLSADGDLWANTDTNFFQTLAGSIALKVTDGRMDRFTLLSRILGLIDLKNWLTAQVPDPRVSGLPFKTLKADFKGEGGAFYTDNLLLDGPVVDITARGDIHLGSGELDMEVAMLPLQSVNWFVHHIPLIGKNLAGGTKDVVAAYFQVRGPFKNPSVTPKPITSVAEFFKKMLAIPINVVAPNTVR